MTTFYISNTGVPALWGEKGYSPVEQIGARPTLDVNGIYAGFTGEGSKTVLPAKGFAKISSRLVPDQTPEEVKKQMVQYMEENAHPAVKWEVKSIHSSGPAISDRNSPWVQSLAKAQEEVWGVRPLFKRDGGTIGFVEQLQRVVGAESILCGFSLPDDNLHAPNEKLHLPTWYKGNEALHSFYVQPGRIVTAETSLPVYGGQAVIEGVMMRGASAVAIAMRDPEGEIVLHTEELGPIYRSRWAKIPFLRGLVILWDALTLGMRALTISANTQTGEDEQLEGPVLYITLGLSLAFSIGLFFLTPALVSAGIENFVDLPSWVGNIIEGIVRLSLLVGYIWTVGRMDDIKRVFGYHGAEHKTINAFEAGAELTPEEVAKFPLEHPRCGTAFLLTVVVFSVVFLTLLGPMSLWPRLLTRLITIPLLLASLAYEYIRWTARHLDSAFVRLLIRPNLALQRLTTREPDLEMLEVSIASFNTMRHNEAELSTV